ncbi:MAG: hypothetical protein HUU38_27415 [Anaerolineales bacterium]|nr:hypothetical protein [Anaerolineales bacterium]
MMTCFSGSSRKLIIEVNLLVTIFLLVSCSRSSEQYTEITPNVTESTEMTQEANTSPLTEELLRERWLNGQPCQPPCWEGIIPGKTTAIEAMSILEKNNIISSLSITDDPGSGVQSGHVEWEIILDDTKPYKGEALFDLDSPNQFIFAIRPGFPNTTLEELIQKLGTPTHILADYYQPPDAENHFWELNVIWMEKGISFTTGGKEPAPTINEALILESVIYFEPSVERFLELWNPRRPDGLTVWKGYGEFSKYLEYLETK